MISEHVMIDLETLNNPDDSDSTLILSIAAVQFRPNLGTTGATFKANIDIQSSLNNGLTVGGRTLKWWLEQDPKVLQSLLINTKRLPEVLRNFNTFLSGVAFTNQLDGRRPTTDGVFVASTDKLRLWGRSPRFDLGILRKAYLVCGIKPNWDGKMELDVRTVEFLNPIVKRNWDDRAKESGSYLTHDPIKDCLHQIGYVSDILQDII